MDSIDAIARSPSFRKWRDAFRETTGIKLSLLDGRSLERSFTRALESGGLCRLLSERNPRCATCRKKFIRRLRSGLNKHPGPFAMRCPNGLTITALPLPLDDGTTAFMLAEPVWLANTNASNRIEAMLRRLDTAGPGIPETQLRKSAGQIPVCGQRKFHAAITLLHLLTRQLSHLSHQLLATPDNGWRDAVAVRRACELIDLRFSGKLQLDEIAREIGICPSYLSHIFSRQMHLSFTQYLANRRVTEMKRLLVDSDISITEALFAAGFQSVSQANRVFRAATDMAPRQFRSAARS